MLELVIIDTNSSATRRESLDGRTLTVGSGIDCDLVLPGEEIAQHHFRLEPVDEGYRLLDLDSDTGTLVNNRSVGRVTLRTGDVVQIGAYKIVVAAAEGTSTTAPTPASAPPTSPEPAPPVPGPHVATTRRSGGGRRGTASRAPAGAERSDTATRRRPQQSSGGLVALAIIALVVIIIGGYAFLNKMDGPPVRSDLDERLTSVRQYSGDCRFGDANREIQDLETDFSDNAAALVRIRKLQGEVRTRESRYDRLRAVLDEVDGYVATDDIDRAIDRLERLVNDAADLPRLLSRVESKMKELQDRRPEKFLDYQGLLSNAKTFDEVLPRVNEMLRAGEYGKALHLATSVTAKDSEKTAQSETLARIQRDARQAAKSKLDRVEELLEDGALFPALNELDEAELLAFRGTDVWYDMLERADEVEELIDEKVPEDFRPVPRRKHARPRPERSESSSRATSTGGSVPQVARDLGETSEVAAWSDRPSSPSRSTSRFDGLFQEAQDLLATDQFAAAAEAFDLALRNAPDPAARQRTTRWMERALRPTWLGERAMQRLAERPDTSVPTLELASGEKAQFLEVENSMLVLSVSDAERQIGMEDLAPRSLLQLTSRMPLEGADLVNRAFLALACDDSRTLLALAEKLSGDEEQRRAVDSLIAFHRDLDPIPPRGFFLVDGDWLTFAEREDLQIRGEIQGMFATLKDDPARLDQVLEGLVEMMEAYPDRVIDSLDARRQEAKTTFLAIPEQERLTRMQVRRAELETAREHALELIYDEEKYFYPYHPPACPPDKARLYHAVQQEVDARVQAVRELWSREAEEYEGSAVVKLSSKTVALIDELHILQRLEKGLLGHRYRMDPTLEPAYHLPVGVRTVNLRTFATSLMERERLDQDREVRLFNATAEVEEPYELGPGEREQVKITNDYRAMLGRGRLAFNAKIHRAAKLHSEWMSRVGRLTHFEDDPQRRTPMDRMRLEDYRSPAGENCSRGSGSASQAHYGWCHSSGHHRNLLWSGHSEMASGQAGSWWTQNFGGGSEYRGNLIGQ